MVLHSPSLWLKLWTAYFSRLGRFTGIFFPFIDSLMSAINFLWSSVGPTSWRRIDESSDNVFWYASIRSGHGWGNIAYLDRPWRIDIEGLNRDCPTELTAHTLYELSNTSSQGTSKFVFASYDFFFLETCGQSPSNTASKSTGSCTSTTLDDPLHQFQRANLMLSFLPWIIIGMILSYEVMRDICAVTLRFDPSKTHTDVVLDTTIYPFNNNLRFGWSLRLIAVFRIVSMCNRMLKSTSGEWLDSAKKASSERRKFHLYTEMIPRGWL